MSLVEWDKKILDSIKRGNNSIWLRNHKLVETPQGGSGIYYLYGEGPENAVGL